MDFKTYQRDSWSTALPSAQNLDYLISGLASEAGEVCGKYAKHIRDGVDNKEALLKEVGDVLWFCSCICTQLGYDYEQLHQDNINKLFDRKNRGVIGGNGDNR